MVEYTRDITAFYALRKPLFAPDPLYVFRLAQKPPINFPIGYFFHKKKAAVCRARKNEKRLLPPQLCAKRRMCMFAYNARILLERDIHARTDSHSRAAGTHAQK